MKRGRREEDGGLSESHSDVPGPLPPSLSGDNQRLECGQTGGGWPVPDKALGKGEVELITGLS